MRRLTLVPLVLALLLWAADGRARDWYACDCTDPLHNPACSGTGSDSNPGTAASPWKSLAKLNAQEQASSSCDDTFNVCRGGAWQITTGSPMEWGNVSSCPAAHNRWVQAYTPSGSTANALPLLYNTNRPNTYQPAFTINSPGGGTGSGSYMQNAIGFRYLEMRCDTGPPYALCNSDIPGGWGGGHGVAFFLQDHVGGPAGVGVILDHMTIDGWGVGINPLAHGGGAPYTLGMYHSSFQLTNSYMHDIAFHGMQGNPTNSLIQNNTFDRIGCRGQPTGCMFEHTVYFNMTQDVVHMVFDHNTILHPGLNANGVCDATIIKLFSGTGTSFTNNTLIVDESGGAPTPNCTGVAMTTQANAVSYPNNGCVNCVLSNNYVYGGNIPIIIDGWISGGTIENNVIVSPHAPGGSMSNGCQWFDIGNTSSGANMGMLGTGPTIRYNTAFIEDQINACRGLEDDLNAGTSPEPGHIKFYGNAVWYNGSNSSARCYDVSAAQLAHYDYWDYNLCQTPALWSGSMTLPTLQSNSVGGVFADSHPKGKTIHPPGFAGSAAQIASQPSSAANAQFLALAAGSYAIGKGDPANYPATDFLGNPRSSPPDAGAFQYGATGGGGTLGPPGQPALVP